MKKSAAAIYIEAGKPMVVDDIDLPDPGPTHVLVKQFATGVCHSQLHELHRPTPNLPLVLGHEATGVVEAVGRDVRHVKEGDHVMVTWVQRNATRATPLPTPARISYRGRSVQFGAPAFTGTFTWASHTLADEQMVVPLDKDVPTDVTSIIGCAVMTGAGAALNSARVRPGDAVAIIGLGGVGLSVVQAVCEPERLSDHRDRPDRREAGIRAAVWRDPHGQCARTEDPVARVRELTGGDTFAGVDFAFDAIGVGPTMEQILLMARPRRPGEREGGTAVLVGVPHGEPPTLAMHLLFGGKVYRGAPGGNSTPDRDFPLLVRWLRDGKLPLDRMVTRRYRLEHINEACDALARGEIAGRAIVEF